MIRLVWCAVPVLVVLTACTEVEMPGPDEGARLFAENCTQCHGTRGQGGVVPDSGQRAPDLTAISARNGGQFPRARVLSQIDGYGRGRVSAQMMPEFGALLTGDLVPVEVDGRLTPTPRPLAALLAYLEGIQSP
ncbi:c-type cytochrome [Sedimentitalea sp. HM32M-2]|uniref:c-type cytochrome n=1 Tax=Sedimentitalea sp. HM32M-2 TaxID=3351566 RepID=UPI00363BA017